MVVYLVRIKTKNFQEIKKIIEIKIAMSEKGLGSLLLL